LFPGEDSQGRFMRRVILRVRPWSPSAFLAALIAIVLAATIQEMFTVFGAKLYFASFFPAILVASLLAGAPAGNKLALKYDVPPDSAALAEIKELPGVIQVDLAGSELSVAATDLGTAAPRVLERLAARGFRCQELTSRRANLEDVFLALTGRTLRDT